jgi:hypothetical protein
VGDFFHIKFIFYSFIGKKRNQKIIYHSLTDYEIWGFRNKEKYFLYDLENQQDDAQEVLEKKITYNNINPEIYAILKIYIENSKLRISIIMNDSYCKYYSTNYAKIELSIYVNEREN